jgi:hypothetical protein
MTPEQLILLMEASAKQYTSMEATINASDYLQEKETSEQIVQGVYEIVTRWSQDKEYWKISRTIYPTADRPNTHEEIVTYSFSPQQTKQLNEELGKIPRGLVRFGGKRDVDQSFYTIHLALWEYCDILWKKFHDQRDMSLKYDRLSNLYEFKVRMEDSSDSAFLFYVDPTKKFIPVKKDYFVQNTLWKHIECSQFQKINDVWIPYSYFCSDLKQSRVEYYEVEQVSVNVPIEDKLFDFDFPKGTVIIDEIANIKNKFRAI